MGFFSKVFGKGDATTLEREPEAVTCPHTSLTPRWDSVGDMGNEERATGYECQSCGESFSPAEGAELRRSEAERVQSGLRLDD